MATPVHEKTFASDERVKLPRPFILRRLHSLLGLWLVLYLSEHLFVNSQAALFFQDEGQGFVSAVNRIHNIPYLKAVELLFLGLPFLIHGIWGMFYALSGKLNAHKTDGSRPALPQYRRNRAYSWQRITSWLLVFGILAHVLHMRFIDYPAHTQYGATTNYMTVMTYDKGLPRVADKLKVTLYDNQGILQKSQDLQKLEGQLSANLSITEQAALQDKIEQQQGWLKAATSKKLKPGQVLGSAPNAGSAFFLIVRETFKSPLLVILYSLFVIAAAYHAFNGLWTFLITWGVTLSRRSQRVARLTTTTLMGIVMFLGLMAAWGTYWTFHFQGVG